MEENLPEIPDDLDPKVLQAAQQLCAFKRRYEMKTSLRAEVEHVLANLELYFPKI